MRTEPGTSQGHDDPEEAASGAVVAADYVTSSTEKSMLDVYAYDENDDLVAIVTVEDVPENGGWVVLGVDRCAT